MDTFQIGRKLQVYFRVVYTVYDFATGHNFSIQMSKSSLHRVWRAKALPARKCPPPPPSPVHAGKDEYEAQSPV